MVQDHADDSVDSGDTVIDGEAYLEYRQAPLNACSIETCCDNPVTMKPPSETNNSNIAAYLPLCLGCYQLDESTGKRNGRLDLFAVPVKKVDSKASAGCCFSIDSFGDSINLLGGGYHDKDSNPPTGVLDGKWYPRKQQQQQQQQQRQQPEQQEHFQNYFASAHASGEILIHQIEQNENTIAARRPFRATLAGKTEPENDNGDASPSLCLALAWDHTSTDATEDLLDTRIVSSYSNGHAAIHKIQQSAPTTVSRLEITLEHYWSAHKMFTAPAEVWCCAFVHDNDSAPTNTVATGGDEGSWKLWDMRTSTTKPLYHCPDDFGAGVTVIAPHPRQPHLLAIGSYDETVALYDVR
ncbi:MAG: hypothetical protein SGILL_006282, partial [Bacillariaceae sp.]